MKEKIILKSLHPEEYGDLVVECTVIENDKIGEYLSKIPEKRKFVAHKSMPVIARKGKLGEVVKTVLITNVNGREYVLHEEEGVVRERPYTMITFENGVKVEKTIPAIDYVITNIYSTSCEEYITKTQQLMKTYEYVGYESRGEYYFPKYDPREVAQVLENVIIVTAWGAKAVCLKGSYIVTYNAEENDYNVIEQGAFNSTYSVVKTGKTRKLKK